MPDTTQVWNFLESFRDPSAVDRAGRNKHPPLATDNLLENTDGGAPTTTPHHCSLGAAPCIPSIYADARYNDAVLVSKAGLLGTDWTSLPQHFKQHGYWTVGSGTVLLQLTLRIKV